MENQVLGEPALSRGCLIWIYPTLIESCKPALRVSGHCPLTKAVLRRMYPSGTQH